MDVEAPDKMNGFNWDNKCPDIRLGREETKWNQASKVKTMTEEGDRAEAQRQVRRRAEQNQQERQGKEASTRNRWGKAGAGSGVPAQRDRDLAAKSTEAESEMTSGDVNTHKSSMPVGVRGKAGPCLL